MSGTLASLSGPWQQRKPTSAAGVDRSVRRAAQRWSDGAPPLTTPIVSSPTNLEDVHSRKKPIARTLDPDAQRIGSFSHAAFHVAPLGNMSPAGPLHARS